MTSFMKSPAVDVFNVQHPGHYIQKTKFLGKYSYFISFTGDIPRRSITNFVTRRGISHEWTAAEGATIYFSDELVIDFVKSITDGVCLRKAITPQAAEALDGTWQDNHLYRLVFAWAQRPSVTEVSEMLNGNEYELVTERRTRWQGDEIVEEKLVVIAILSNDHVQISKLNLALSPAIYQAATSASTRLAA